MKKYDAKKPLEIEGRDKPIWMGIGMSVTIKDDGKVFLFDNRTGMNYPCFERKPREETTPQHQSDQASASAPESFDVIPF